MTVRSIKALNGVTVRAIMVALVMASFLFAGIQQGRTAEAAEGSIEAVFGNAVAVTVPDSLTVATDSEVVKLLFDDDSTISGQGIESLADVAEGDRVIATAYRQEDDSLVASRVLIQPILSKPVTKHIFGVVVESAPGEVVVQDRNGNVVTLDVTSGMELPAVGEAVTVVALLDRSTGRLEAKAFQSVADTVQRIEDAAEAAGENPDGERLSEVAEDARAKHLSILEQARIALEQARAALAQAQGDTSQAEARLAEVQAQYERIRQQYEAWAEANNQPAPKLRLNGILTYVEDTWAQEDGSFTLRQRGADGDAASGIEFQFTSETLVTFTVIDRPELVADADEQPSAGVSAGVSYRKSDPAPISEVKDLVESGSSAVVLYNPDQRPLTALEIIILPPELDEEVSDAIEAERLRSFQGVITLVEQDVDIDDATGVVVVASDARGEKVAAIVTPATVITVNGIPATIGDLAAGHVVNVVFEQAEPSDDNTASRGRFRAASIDTRTASNEDAAGIVGVIRQVSPDDSSLVILTREGSIKATVPEATRVSLDGEQARLSDLSAGDLVLDGTRYNRRSGEILALVAASPREQAVRGTIVGLAVDPAKVVISTGNGGVVTLVVSDDTELTTEDGGDIEFSELSVGQLVVKGTYAITRRDSSAYLLANALVIAEPSIAVANGVVREVDASTPLLHITVTRSTTGSTESLSLSVSDRSEMHKNGQQIHSLDPVEPGDIVNSVAYSPSTNTIVKLSVSSPNLVSVRGTVLLIGGMEELTILSSDGRRIQLGVTEETALTLNGRSISSLRDVQRGDVVSEANYIVSSNDRTTGRAVSISLLRRQVSTSPNDPTAPSVETTVTGVIDRYEPGKWIAISGRRFRINDETRFTGAEPEAGLVARATLVLDRDGVFVVTSINVVANPEDDSSRQTDDPNTGSDSDSENADTTRISGVVDALSETAVVVDQTRIVINRDTKIDGTLTVGSSITVLVQRTSDGLLVAIEIDVIEPNDRDRAGDDSAADGVTAATQA